ncbi:MAG: sulfite oxidase [Dehalococcoidia bacterium]|nr:sulfite oxidase [Dehalococcoidia bacterium]
MKDDARGPAGGGEDAEGLWEYASARGMSRRHFLRLMVAGGAAAVVAACVGPSALGGTPQPIATEAAPGAAVRTPWFKDPAPFIRHGDLGLEGRLENQQGLITPNDLFFVRNNSASIDVKASDWRLSVEGDAVAEALELTYEEVRSLPSRTLVSYLECAGNHRALFDVVQGRKASGTQWMTGAVGNGEWVGVALRDVLTLAGVHASAVSVLLAGLDADSPEGGFRYVLPAEKAMDPDTLLAYALNGETLPKDHGFPLRALVPGWIGSASIKWLGRIVVSSQPLWTRNNTTSYVLIGDAYPPEGEAQGRPVSEQVIKSALALPWPAELAAGKRRIHGYAHSPHAPIARVQWSADGGGWSDAETLGRQVERSWAQFEFVWEAERGERVLMTRATDAAGNTQPGRVPFNEKGYLFNQPAPHPVRVI